MPPTPDNGKSDGVERALALSRQLAQGVRWLRFEPGIESAYRADQFRANLRYLRFSLVMLVALILVIIRIDHVVMPDIRAALPDFARLGVMLPLLGVAFAITFLRRADVWYPRAMAVLMSLALVGVTWVGLWAWGQGEPRLFIRLLIGTIAVYFMLGLPFRSAVAVNLVAIAFYVGAATSHAMPDTQLLHNLAMLVMTNVICATGAFNLEHLRRIAWLEGQLLADSALQDGLTGIHNRRRFDEHLQRVWQQGVREHKPLALLFADIDHFKKYNDRYGHQAGDEAMKAVAGVLGRFARRPLDLVARYGGEEFAIVLFDASREHAARIGDEILGAVRALGIRHADSAAAGVLTISIGIACIVPVARRSSSGLVQLADQALYAAKDGGRNRVQLLEEEYEHMKTGYFRRQMTKGDGQPGDQ
jgi:diguanylate cyclase (GGDEF)-like protein